MKWRNHMLMARSCAVLLNMHPVAIIYFQRQGSIFAEETEEQGEALSGRLDQRPVFIRVASKIIPAFFSCTPVIAAQL